MQKRREPIQSGRWSVRLMWLIGIWAASIGALALVAYALRLVMGALGMTTGSPS